MAISAMEALYNGQGNASAVAWWDKSVAEKDVWKSICETVRYIDSRQRQWRRRNRINVGMYSETMMTRLGYNNATMVNTLPDSRMKLNVVRSCVDAATAYIGSQRPKVFYLTDKGNWQAQTSAKKMNRFMQGLFYNVNQYEKSPTIFQNAAIMGTCFAFPFIDDDDLVDCDIVLSENILVDERETLFRSPKTLYRYDEYPRDVLIDRFCYGKPELRKAMMAATNSLRSDANTMLDASDMVSVIEAWHIDPKGKGRHCIVTDACTLLDEEYSKKYIPILPMRWSKMPYGYYGQGIGDILYSVQVELNYLLMKIQTLMTLATTQVFLEAGSKLNKQTLTNVDFAAHEYTGAPPIFHAVQSVSPEYFEQSRYYYNIAFELCGISQLAAQAAKPAGLNSGRALVEMNDVQSRRFQDITNRYDDFHVNLAKMYADLVEDVFERTGKYSVLSRDKNSVSLLDFKEIKLDEKTSMVIPFPTNFFSSTPTAKYQQVSDMLRDGFLSREQASVAMDYPDTEAITSVYNAPFDYLNLCVERMIEHGEPQHPDPVSNLGLAMSTLPLQILRAETMGVDDTRIQLVRNYLDEVNDMLGQKEDQAKMQQQQLMQAQMAAQMQGVPQEIIQGQMPQGQQILQ